MPELSSLRQQVCLSYGLETACQNHKPFVSQKQKTTEVRTLDNTYQCTLISQDAMNELLTALPGSKPKNLW